MYSWHIQIVCGRTDRVVKQKHIRADDWDAAERILLKLIKSGQYGRLDGRVVERYYV